MRLLRSLPRHLVTCVLAASLFAAEGADAADIRLGVEVEFRSWYRHDDEVETSFQLRESKLFLDTFISPRLSALLEFAIKKENEKPRIERGFFLWRPGETRVKFGQFRIPIGYWDAFTIDRSLTKNTPIGANEAFDGFRLRKHDVGVEVESRFRGLTATLAVVNGSTIDRLEDGNEEKDFVGKIGLRLGGLAVNANGYAGTQAGLAGANRSVNAIGFDGLYFRGPLTIGGEGVLRLDVGETRAAGGYGQLQYDLLDVLYGLRFVAKVEYWDPNTRQPDDDVTETIVGLKQTLVRGMTLQIEYQIFSRNTEQYSDGVLMEIELEL